MKDKPALLTLYKSLTGKTTHTPIPDTGNLTGYQVSRVDHIDTYGYGGSK